MILNFHGHLYYFLLYRTDRNLYFERSDISATVKSKVYIFLSHDFERNIRIVTIFALATNLCAFYLRIYQIFLKVIQMFVLVREFVFVCCCAPVFDIYLFK